ncbi:MAG: hypothetical protein ACOCXJ_02275 [Planctomycetota bacterium]
MKIIFDLDAATHKRLQVLAGMRKQKPEHLGADLLTRMLSQQMSQTEEQVANTGDLAEVLAARLLQADGSGDQIRAALAELRMLDDTAHNRLVQARLKQALQNADLQAGSAG